MRTLILIALLFASIVLRAQDTIINYPDTIFDVDYINWTTVVKDSTITPNECKAYFQYSVNTKIMTFAPATVLDFIDQSEGGAMKWFWDFGDGYTDTVQNPTHIFNLPVIQNGVMVKLNPYRTVTLTILTSDSCKSFYSETIDIYNRPVNPDPRCKAAFKHYTLSYDSIAGKETFQFSNRSEGDTLSYLWQFDDGSTSTEIEPSFTYDFSQPMHKVILTITSSNGCTDTFGEDVFMDYPGGGSTNPVDSTSNGCFVAFGYTVNSVIKTLLPALVLDFYTKSDNEIVSWNWDFGDGYTDTIQNPTHIFNFPIVSDSIPGEQSSYRNVCLTTKTASGCESTWCQTIDIYSGTTPPAPGCHPWFKGYVPYDVVTVPEVVPFQFANGSEGDVVSCLWQFEDGTTSTEREPLVMFDKSKPTQYVCLTITTSDSCTSTWCETIDITPPVIDTTVYVEPVCNYTFNYTSAYPKEASACVGKATAQVVLKDSAISTDYYYWTSGDGKIISNEAEVTNLCPTQTYTVTARTTDGCKFSGSFIFNSDGTVTKIPVNWWIYRANDVSYVNYNLNNSDYTVEWVLCDGTVVTSDSIRLSEIDCGNNEANLLMKDAKGNIVYSENVTMKAKPTSNKEIKSLTKISFYPVPVINVLNVNYNCQPEKTIRFEICDLSGKTQLIKNFYDIKTNQHLIVDVSALTKGIYLGKIIADNKIIAVEKFNK